MLELITVVSTYLQYNLLDNYAHGVAYNDAQLGNNDLRVQLVMLVYWAFFVMSGIVFIMWFRRAYYNLHQCTNNLRFKDVWATVFWFVPIVKLFRPFTIVKELFAVSEALLRKQDVNTVKSFPSFYLGAWWIFWLINNLIIQFLNSITPEGDELDNLSHESLYYIFQNIASITAGLLLIKIIKAYNLREKLLLKLMEEDQTIG